MGVGIQQWRAAIGCFAQLNDGPSPNGGTAPNGLRDEDQYGPSPHGGKAPNSLRVPWRRLGWKAAAIGLLLLALPALLTSNAVQPAGGQRTPNAPLSAWPALHAARGSHIASVRPAQQQHRHEASEPHSDVWLAHQRGQPAGGQCEEIVPLPARQASHRNEGQPAGGQREEIVPLPARQASHRNKGQPAGEQRKGNARPPAWQALPLARSQLATGESQRKGRRAQRTPWGGLALGLLQCTKAATCIKDLLLISGVEANPGPDAAGGAAAAAAANQPWVLTEEGMTAQQKALDKIVAMCKDSKPIANLLQKYNPRNSNERNLTEFKKSKKNVLVDTMTFLGVPGSEVFTASSITNKLISRIQNLMPDMCPTCNEAYSVELDEKPLVSCCMCGQGAHRTCMAVTLGLDQDQLDATTTEEAQLIINPRSIKTLHYMCTECSKASIPDPNEGMLCRYKATNAATAPPVAGEDDDEEVEEEAVAVDAVALGAPTRRHRKSGDDNPPTADAPKAPTVAPKAKDDNPTAPANDTNPKDKAKKDEDDNDKDDICPYYKKGTCRHGVAGTKCPKDHPTPCKRYLKNGNKQGTGCTKGKECKFFHMPICAASLKKGSCLEENCKKHHLAGTARANSRPVCPGSEKKRVCLDTNCEKRHLKGTRRASKEDAEAGQQNQNFLDVNKMVVSLKEEFERLIDSKLSKLQPQLYNLKQPPAQPQPQMWSNVPTEPPQGMWKWQPMATSTSQEMGAPSRRVHFA